MQTNNFMGSWFKVCKCQTGQPGKYTYHKFEKSKYAHKPLPNLPRPHLPHLSLALCHTPLVHLASVTP